MSNKNDHTFINVRVPLELRMQLAKAAHAEGRSLSAMAVHFLDSGVSHLEGDSDTRPPAAGMEDRGSPATCGTTERAKGEGTLPGNRDAGNGHDGHDGFQGGSGHPGHPVLRREAGASVVHFPRMGVSHLGGPFPGTVLPGPSI